MDFNGRPSVGGVGGDVSFDSVCATSVQAYRISQAASCGATPNFTLPLTGPPNQTPSQLSVMTAASTLTNNIRITVPSSLQYVVHRGVGQLAYIALQPGDYPLETSLFPQIELALRNALYAIGGVGTFTLTLVGGKIEITTSPGNNATQVDIWSQTQDATVVNYLLGAPSGVQVNVAIPGDIPYLFPNFPSYVVVTSPELNWSPYFSAPIEATDTIISGDGASSITALNAPANPSIVSSGNWGYGGASLANMVSVTASAGTNTFPITNGGAQINLYDVVPDTGFEVKLLGTTRFQASSLFAGVADATDDSVVYVATGEAHIVSSLAGDDRISLTPLDIRTVVAGNRRVLVDTSDTWQYSPDGNTYTQLSDGSINDVVGGVDRLRMDGGGTVLLAQDGITGLDFQPDLMIMSTSAGKAFYADSGITALLQPSTGTGVVAAGSILTALVDGNPVLYCDNSVSALNAPSGSSNQLGVDASGAFTSAGVPFNAGDLINATAGAAAAPSLVFDSDIATGFYHPAASTVALSVAGAQVGRWTATGLAIRTATTSGALRVGDSGSAQIYLENTGVADGGSPYAYLSMVGGLLNIGKANRSAGEPTAFIDALTVAATGRLNAGVGLTLRGEPNNVCARLFASYGSASIAAVTTETALFSGSTVGSATIGASSAFLAIGSSLQFEAAGTLTVTALNSIRFRLRASTGGVAGTIVLDTGTIGTAVAAQAYTLSLVLVVESATVSKVSGTLVYGGGLLSQSFYVRTTSFSTAIANTFSLTGQYALAGDTLTNEMATIVSMG